MNARESIRVTGGNIDWIYPGRNERTSFPSYKDSLSFELNPANPATTLGK